MNRGKVFLIVLYIFLIRVNKKRSRFLIMRPILLAFIPFIFMFFVWNFYGMVEERKYLLSAPRKVVEGRITVYQPDYGHGRDETIEVNGIKFHYAFSAPTAAFNSSNGILQNGQYVRIEYVDGAIVKLEVAK